MKAKTSTKLSKVDLEDSYLAEARLAKRGKTYTSAQVRSELGLDNWINKRGVDMSDAPDERLLEALLDSWDRNNTILVNLLRALPEGGLEVKSMDGSPSIGELFTHIRYVRLVFVFEDAPEFARELPAEEWAVERDRGRMAQMLNDSAKAVRDAVKSRVQAGRHMDLHYDHPILFLQHMVWHEGYHHGQIKLALKLAGRPITDEEAGPVTWGVWMRKK
jgi:uncharacterized damage-inducible protein DinB